MNIEVRVNRSSLPRLDWVTVCRNGSEIRAPYCHRSGTGAAVLFIHGLGEAKENFYGAFQSPALTDCELLAFDFPDTGLAEFDQDKTPDVSAFADLAYFVCANYWRGRHTSSPPA